MHIHFFDSGYARLSNVEFIHTGQDGFTETYDARFSLAYISAGEVSDAKPSFVSKCSFHDSFNSAVGALGITGLHITDNVLYNVLGNGKYKSFNVYVTIFTCVSQSVCDA